MKLPKKVHVGPLTYRVKRRRIVMNNGAPLMGKAAHTKCMIQVATAIEDQRQRETFMHEIIHVISCDRDLGLEEHAVDQISAGLVDVLLRNQDVTRLYIHD